MPKLKVTKFNCHEFVKILLNLLIFALQIMEDVIRDYFNTYKD